MSACPSRRRQAGPPDRYSPSDYDSSRSRSGRRRERDEPSVDRTGSHTGFTSPSASDQSSDREQTPNLPTVAVTNPTTTVSSPTPNSVQIGVAMRSGARPDNRYGIEYRFMWGIQCSNDHHDF